MAAAAPFHVTSPDGTRIAAAHIILRESRQAEHPADPARFAAIRTPTLLLLGGDGPAIFREATNRLHAALPDSRVHVFAGQQHIAMDLVPEAVTDAPCTLLLPASAAGGTAAGAAPAP